MHDLFVAVDWSAANRAVRGPNSIWIATGDGRGAPTLTNPTTREQAMTELRRTMLDGLQAGRRIIVGLDAGFGYPAGTATALGLSGLAWSATWQLIAALVTDDGANHSNRFAVAAELNRRLGGNPGPFWGGPAAAVGPDLGAKRAPFPNRTTRGELAEYRTVEHALRTRGHRTQSVWKLYTTGSVGSQTLLAIARLQGLRSDPALAGRLRIWPFEIDRPDDLAGPVVIVTELWPNLAPFALDPAMIPDAAQVTAAVRWLAELAATDQLEAKLLLRGVDADVARIARTEEGWILGAESAETTGRTAECG